ncbi:putative thioesterase [Bacillus tianshenii]|uniref:Thioesterase n=1 Tax=Sutcliffiella tianshenii TaxID=1463404 RepID=A0ABS2NXD5_9BACI|nr:putative thioesterase [Bacillus tianshenii]
MKPGLKEGSHKSLTIKVTPSMFAQFEGQVVHPVYSTATMVYHMEWVSRQIILPFLEEEEEGMGAEVSVKHLSPAAEGTELILHALVTNLTRNSIHTEVTVKAGDRVVGEGKVKQAVLSKSKINRIIGQD